MPATAGVSASPERGPASAIYVGDKRIDELYLQRLHASRGQRLQLVTKRAADVLVSGFFLLCLAPLFLLCFLGIKLTSKGPFLFSQRRWGLHQTQFKCLKMRSMYSPSDSRLQAMSATAEDGTLMKLKKDPRVTPLGRLLRRTSVDELPQLWNIFVGEMSLVGPRPLMLPMLEPFPEIRAARCAVRPGVTGVWQIRNRKNNTHIFQMIADDAEYIREFSLWQDIRILCATPLEVLKGSGAH